MTTTADNTTDAGTLPGRDIEWDPDTVDEIPVEDPTATVIMWPRGTDVTLDLTTKSYASTISSGVFGKIIGGADAYKEKFGERELDIPPYYSRFDEFETVPCKTSALGHDWGHGIDAKRLEQAIRLATGGGRFSVDDLTITMCGKHPFVIETDDAAYVMATRILRNYDGDEIISEREVAGMTVTNEMDDFVLEGIKQAQAALADQFDIHLTEHVRRAGGRHVFRAADGEQYSFTGHDLANVWTELEPEILGDHTVWHRGEHTVTVTEDDLRYPIGSDQEIGGRIVGYALDANSTVSAYRGTRTTKIRAKPIGVRLRENGETTRVNASMNSGAVVYED